MKRESPTSSTGQNERNISDALMERLEEKLGAISVLTTKRNTRALCTKHFFEKSTKFQHLLQIWPSWGLESTRFLQFK